jgi:hypothetical protein
MAVDGIARAHLSNPSQSTRRTEPFVAGLERLSNEVCRTSARSSTYFSMS